MAKRGSLTRGPKTGGRGAVAGINQGWRPAAAGAATETAHDDLVPRGGGDLEVEGRPHRTGARGGGMGGRAPFEELDPKAR
jgi:hypothetical protein